ncbi:MAG: restriction endonuclease subunit S [bacterium]|nr:restriction endonuclease subunit S [bacterium]
MITTTRKKSAVPDGWRMVRLREVADINRRKWTPRQGGSIRYLDLTAVETPGQLSPPKDLASEDAPSRARRLVVSGDTLISTVRPYLKGHVQIRDAPPDLVASTGFAVVSPGPVIHSSLIFHHAIGYSFAQHLEARMTGQAYPAVRPSDVGSYEFPLPLLEEQRAIASVLDAIDDEIEQTDRVIAAAERLRDALLHELLTKGLPGWHTEWQEHPKLGAIPLGWNAIRLGEAAGINSQTWTPRQGGSILYLDLTAVPAPGQIAPATHLDAEEAPSRARRLVRSGDTLISTVRPYLKGHVLVRRAPPNLVASTGFAVVSPGTRIHPSLLFHHAMAPSFTRHLEARMVGQAYPAVRPSDVASYTFALPPSEEQEAIAEMLDGVDNAIERTRREKAALTAFKESMSDALLTGRVRVPIHT